MLLSLCAIDSSPRAQTPAYTATSSSIGARDRSSSWFVGTPVGRCRGCRPRRSGCCRTRRRSAARPAGDGRRRNSARCWLPSSLWCSRWSGWWRYAGRSTGCGRACGTPTVRSWWPRRRCASCWRSRCSLWPTWWSGGAWRPLVWRRLVSASQRGSLCSCRYLPVRFHGWAFSSSRSSTRAQPLGCQRPQGRLHPLARLSPPWPLAGSQCRSSSV